VSDYYDILGVSKNASDTEIKKAFRKQAMRYHPDRNQGDKNAEESFKKVNEAYAVLSDTKKRKQYDVYGDSSFHQQYSQEDIFRGTDFGSIFEEFGLGDSFFSQIFGGGSRDQSRRSFGGQMRGQDVEYPLTVTFEDALKGGEKRIQFQLSGGISRDLTIKIPKGIQTGAKLRVNGRGAPGPQGGRPGDLFVIITVAEHPTFKRTGANLDVDLHLKMSEAVLGVSKEVQTIDGARKVKIPSGVQPGTRIRLKGQGFPKLNTNESGDLFAVIKIAIPQEISDRQRQLLIDLQDSGL